MGVLLCVAALGCSPPPRESSPDPGQTQPPASAGPRHDLARDEEAGGHTLRKHVGRTGEQLRERLEREPHISAASTYADRATAERVVGITLAEQQHKIQRWREREGGHPNLVLDYNGDPAHPIGSSLRRGDAQTQPCSHAVVVLKWAGPNHSYILTTYPECR